MTVIRSRRYGDVLLARGITMVALNDDGEILEYGPDGSSSAMAPTTER